MKFKTFIMIEAVFVILMSISARFSDSVFTLFLLCCLAFPVVYFVKSFRNHVSETLAKGSKAEITEPAEPKKPEPKWQYLWLVKEDQTLGNKFEKWYKEELNENPEYFRSNKDLREDYYDEKIYQYEPFELPFKIEENKVFSYMKEDEWIPVGTIKKNDQEAVKNALETKLCLMPNRYKHVGDDYVQKENGDTYFGLKVLLDSITKK